MLQSFACRFAPWLALVPVLVAANTVAAAAKKNLARVAILTFEDETQTKNFAYMPDSLTEAIDKSLQQRFEYVREEPKKSETQRRQIKQRGLLDAREAALYCTKYDVQILVYGKFTYDAARRQIVVDTWISLGTERDFRQLAERRNPTDASIFNLADKVADDIVREMTQIAREQRQNKTADKPADSERVELERRVPVVWAFKPYTLHLGLGALYPMGELNTPYRISGTVSIAASRLIWYGLYASANLQAFRLKSRDGGTYSSTLTVVPATLGIGYAWFLFNDRLRLNAEGGGGYYGAKLEILSGSSTIYTLNFNNPAVRVAVGAHWLLYQSFAIGLEASYLQLVDKDQVSGKITNLQVVASYVF